MRTPIHNEWIMPLAKKRCPNDVCRAKYPCVGYVVAWGQYVNGRWRTITHACPNCFINEVLIPLRNHIWECGCSFDIVARSGYSMPRWLRQINATNMYEYIEKRFLDPAPLKESTYVMLSGAERRRGMTEYHRSMRANRLREQRNNNSKVKLF